MKISVILPCFNMEKYIEETLKSIIEQNYTDLELIVVDGGSSDKTLQIINKYKKYISILISEKDTGQYNAINKGMRLATGEILAWLNADDIYFPWTFKHVSEFFSNNPNTEWISGITSTMDSDGLINAVNKGIIVKPKNYIQNGWFQEKYYGYLQQEGMFWKKSLWEKSGGLNEKYKLAADFELWTRYAKHADLVSFGIPLACFRNRKDSRSKSLVQNYNNEVNQICKNLKKPSLLKRFFFKQGLKGKLFMRKFSITKGQVYYYSFLNKKWIFTTKFSTMSTHSLSNFIFHN